MRLLVTRPREDAAELSTRLTALGHHILLDPLLSIVFKPEALPDLAPYAALVFTSSNGVRAFASASPRRDLPVFAVGDRTRATAQEAGFTEIATAEGDSTALARLILTRHSPASGKLLHIAASEVAGDLAGPLHAAGIELDRTVLYEAVAKPNLAAATRRALAAGEIDGVLLFSPRTARLFVEKLAAAKLGEASSNLTAWCLSRNVAEALGDLALLSVEVAALPTQDALINLIDSRDKNVARQKEPAVTEPQAGAPIQIEAAPVAATPEDMPPPVRQPRRVSWRLVGILLVLAIVALAAPLWLPKLHIPQLLAHNTLPPPPPPIAPVASIPAKIVPAPAVVTPPVAPVPEAAPPPVAAPLVDDTALLGPMRSQLDAVQTRVAALESKLDTTASTETDTAQQLRSLANSEAALSGTLNTLGARITQQQQQLQSIAAADAGARALVLAAGELRMALTGSGPYDAPLQTLRALAPNDTELQAPLATLGPWAKTGLVGREILTVRLGELDPQLTMPLAVPQNAPWWRRLLNRIRSLVTISRVAENNDPATLPPGPQRFLAEAQAAMAKGDLAGAVDAVRSIDGPKAGVVTPWLVDASARLAGEQAADRIDAIVTRRLAANAPATGQN